MIVEKSAVFSTWIPLKKKIERLKGEPKVAVDLSRTSLVDHTVISKLQELEKEFEENQSTLVVTGLDEHRKLSNHPQAARKKAAR